MMQEINLTVRFTKLVHNGGPTASHEVWNELCDKMSIAGIYASNFNARVNNPEKNLFAIQLIKNSGELIES